MRRPLVVGNWKMNGSTKANASLVNELVSLVAESVTESTQVDVVVCTPFVYIDQARQCLAKHAIACGAQDLSVHLDGAYTGEISAAMLVDLGCKHVIVGHSERREYHHESDLLVAQKTLVAQQSGLIPIICVGESLQQREAGDTLRVISEQLAAVKSVVGERSLLGAVIAYEPVWAIGSGLTATPEQVQAVHEFIRDQLGSAADAIQIIYGGSVKADNAASLFEQRDIDGALVGGASLKAKDFFGIVSAA
ncbi:MAG: triosephosphate isomerase [Candidatus Endobugula sp.]|jgi:triosephosphate isomerase